MVMRVLHISTTDDGGAGLAAYRLHHALLSQGVESRMLVASKTKIEDEIVLATPSPRLMYQPPKNKVVRKIKKLLRKRGYFKTRAERFQQDVKILRQTNPVFLYTSPVSVYDLSEHPLVEEADVIHLHWVQNFINFDDFFDKIKKPIVWTLHDLNPFYGGFHYSKLRDQYYSAFREIEEDFYGIKKKALLGKTNVSTIAISREMHERIESHEFFKDKPIYDVYNSVDDSRFLMFDKVATRNMLQIPLDKCVFLFVNRNLNDEQKGLMLLIEALRSLDMKNVLLVCVGDGMIPEIEGVEIRRFSSVNDSIWLSQLYSMTDFLVLPSYQEAFSQTTIEAMCCGAPVVMTPVSGSDDLIAENNGVRCDGFSVVALGNGIRKAMERKDKYDREWIRMDVVRRFGVDSVTKRVIDVYNKVLERHC